MSPAGYDPMSIKRLGGRTCESRHVSSSPSKIPYGGFSPVRLQTGYWPWRPSPAHRSAVSARHASTSRCRRLIRHHPPSAGSPMVLSDMWSGPLPGRLQSSGPWLASGLSCPTRSLLTMAASESLGHFRRFMYSYNGSSPVSLIQGSSREVPRFTLPVFPSVPTSIPRWTGKVLLTVSSLPALAFTSLAMFRHPNIPRNPIQRGGLTRLQSLLHVTARQVCSPCIGQDFYSRAFTPFVAIGSVEYNYTGKQSIPAAGLSPARHAALWAANQTKPNGQAGDLPHAARRKLRSKPIFHSKANQEIGVPREHTSAVRGLSEK
jgi:hypothetical protein